MKNNIGGVGVALVTPFKADFTVDLHALGKVVRNISEGGVDYLVALGTTAETPTLTEEEKLSVVKCVRENNISNLPLVIGIGGNDTRSIIESFSRYNFDGVDAVLSVTPYYNKPTQEGLYQHYKAVAKASPVPVMLYNVPARTGVNMTAETTLRIARDVDNILGIKEACGVVTQMMKILKSRPDGFKVISGDDCLALSLGAIGGDGVISVAANAFPYSYTEMVNSALAGKRQQAADLHIRFSDIFEALFIEGNPAGVKAAMSIQGIIEPHVRLPLVPASEELTSRLKDLIDAEMLR